MESICYKKNFITEAISKIEFLNPITDLDKSLPKTLSDDLKGLFPIAESRTITNNIVDIVGDEVKKRREESTEWNFWNKERKRKITISKNVLMLVQYNYTTFKDFSDEFLTALNSICSIYNELIIKRYGVRYINNIRLKEENPLDWSDYINSELIASINIPKDRERISRTFHNLEMNYQEFNLRFNFGIHNPDYPALIKQKAFVLDMDAYHTGVQNKSDIEDSMPKFHNKIQEFFEFSITENFREKHLNNA